MQVAPNLARSKIVRERVVVVVDKGVAVAGRNSFYPSFDSEMLNNDRSILGSSLPSRTESKRFLLSKAPLALHKGWLQQAVVSFCRSKIQNWFVRMLSWMLNIACAQGGLKYGFYEFFKDILSQSSPKLKEACFTAGRGRCFCSQWIKTCWETSSHELDRGCELADP
jgi:hypothetical protein